ncbi:hypothetical protein D9O50_04270 [Oxalobacteraceae bacterium CAVE-383]|nr:hypothetical protein D9O50_04270 [Oxalobacteraceae bacterium CAVE-383]
MSFAAPKHARRGSLFEIEMGGDMKFACIANAMLSAMVLTGMSGCSDSPSDDDVKLAIRDMTGQCPQFTITHVLKVNWGLPGTNEYQVDMQYSIESAPLPDAKTATAALASPVAAVNARIAAASIERDRDFKIHAGFLDRIEKAQKAGEQAAAGVYERERAEFSARKLEPSLKLSRELAAEKAALIKKGTQRLRDEFFRACPNTPFDVYDRVYDNTDIAQYVEKQTMDFATSIRMTKTEKGWRIKQ